MSGTTSPTRTATSVVARPLRPTDVPAVHAMVARCNASTLRARFLGYRHDAAEALTTGLLSRLPAGRIDIGVLAAGGDLVGIGSLIPAPDQLWEVAVLVEDEWHGHGVGSLLADALLAAAHARRIDDVVAYCSQPRAVVPRLAAGRAVLAPGSRTGAYDGEYRLRIAPGPSTP
jgi:GNAT superfamily N-acetyltransferase